jgi:hypothetical protein
MTDLMLTNHPYIIVDSSTHMICCVMLYGEVNDWDCRDHSLQSGGLHLVKCSGNLGGGCVLLFRRFLLVVSVIISEVLL